MITEQNIYEVTIKFTKKLFAGGHATGTTKRLYAAPNSLEAKRKVKADLQDMDYLFKPPHTVKWVVQKADLVFHHKLFPISKKKNK